MARAKASQRSSSSVWPQRSLRGHTGEVLEFDATLDVDIRDHLLVLLDLSWKPAGEGPESSRALLTLDAEAADRLAHLLSARAAQLRRSSS